MKSIAVAALFAGLAAAEQFYVYVGTYTGPQSKGIYVFRLDTEKASLEPLGIAAETRNPSFLAIHPNGKYLYAAGEVSGGVVTAFALDPKTGRLREINSASSRGSGPAYVTVDRKGRCALVANYGSGSFAALPIADGGAVREATGFVQDKGSSVNPQRQREPHAHSINVSPENRFAVGADLGTDQLLVFRFDASKCTLEPNQPPFTSLEPGSGPRHFAFHPNGKFAYAINELKSTVTAFSWDGQAGVLQTLQTVSALPEGFQGNSTTAEVQVHPNGKFLYGSNRGHDSIAVFAIDGGKGTLTPVQHVSTQGRTPRNFGIDPTGSVLIAANQNSDTLAVFRIDGKTGKLVSAGAPVSVPRPVCVKFVKIR